MKRRLIKSAPDREEDVRLRPHWVAAALGVVRGLVRRHVGEGNLAEHFVIPEQLGLSFRVW